jgi:probable H4MPT-linked C1 transfer pathway protein
MNRCIGWDVGGVNLKAVAIDEAWRATTLESAFEIWREPRSLGTRLAGIGARLGPAPLHALTMTAELADCFATKREGVSSVVDAVVGAFPEAGVRVFGTGGFVPPERARLRALDIAAANWCAAAAFLAEELSGAGILLDTGSTTTDVIPFLGGRVAARGRTDLERLLAGELVYTGALRTPLAAILSTAPVGDRECPVAAEHFAIAADAHLWLGTLEPDDYTCPTPDAGAATREAAGSRLARVVCEDRASLGDAAVTVIARRVADLQVAAIADALARVAAALRSLSAEAASTLRVFTAGSGAWLAEAAAARVGIPFEPLTDRLGKVARVLPAYAVARLALQDVSGRSRVWLADRTGSLRLPSRVVKVGGSLARDPDVLSSALRALAGARPFPLVVPGGGPLADAVRRLHAGGGVSQATAHRMALLALDQSALWMAEVASSCAGSTVVRSPEEIARATEVGLLPILAPAAWLAKEDALPASWEVTSDSIAAWVAGRIGACRLLLLKSFAFRSSRIEAEELGDAVDPYFARALSPAVECRLVDGREPGSIVGALAGEEGAGTIIGSGRNGVEDPAIRWPRPDRPSPFAVSR